MDSYSPVATIKCWYIHICVISCAKYWHCYNTCHIKFTYMFMTWLLYLEGKGGVVTNEKAAKPVTTVRDCDSTFVSMKPLSVFGRPQDINSQNILTLAKFFFEKWKSRKKVATQIHFNISVVCRIIHCLQLVRWLG